MTQDEYDIERETGGLAIDVCKMEERRVRNILKGTAPYTHEPPASRSRTVRQKMTAICVVVAEHLEKMAAIFAEAAE